MLEKNVFLFTQDNLILISTFFQKYFVYCGRRLIGITLVHAITDPINQMITITKYTLYTEYAIERQLGLDQSGSV